jgi:hypothetical protein
VPDVSTQDPLSEALDAMRRAIPYTLLQRRAALVNAVAKLERRRVERIEGGRIYDSEFTGIAVGPGYFYPDDEGGEDAS